MLFQIKVGDASKVSKAMAAGEHEEETARRLVPLPDIVLTSPSYSNSTVRRGRSASVNLPPEPEVIQNIGRSLRRMSDEFQSFREAGQNRRRQTITSCDSYYRAS
ncbi:hypothetical protein JTE90_022859 [Oedothorax gibbosus]|uniref:Uncharacterized protein n=1 Tax=Oedothorax gibbosus TaxID=931172 RepID=A0AAV6TTP1_9ARAC|nr:hypothetical protein JTE90_022859 [Oedothorax gibbosus]